MLNFDFHNLLFSREFEKLCRDILAIRETPINFTTNGPGNDGGIDIRATNVDIEIIGQCKLYAPGNYSSFYSSLKKELPKCKRLNPDRYILCTNLHLTTFQKNKILQLFKGYVLNEEDIIDGEKLNMYLNDSKYNHLLKSYSKLLVPNFHFIESALENIINKKYYAQTNSFLRTLTANHKLFHNTSILENCISLLEHNKVLILTGNPGVGKTTTAKMITTYFTHQKIKNILFLSNVDFFELEGLLLDNQLIVVDDFWGQNFSPNLRNGTLLRNFTRIINDIKNSDNRYLILTSREYIVKDVLNHAESETIDLLNSEKFIINLDNFSKEDKVRIFLNHLLYYDFGKEYFNYLKHDDILDSIISHLNYSPRHIEYYIKEYLKKEVSNKYDFFKLFYKYLDKPQEYWNNNFKKLNDTSQIILLISLISSDPIDVIDLKSTFEETQEASRLILNKNIYPLEFNDELKLLEDFYLVSEKYYDQVLIRFQNPGIKDFLLEYLRTDGKMWIKPLIENAQFFNQLYFVFSTSKEKIYDYDSDLCLYGDKIVLSEKLQIVLKNKLLKEFHCLNFSTQERREYTGDFSKIHSANESKYWKLRQLNNLFPIVDERNIEVRKFIIDEVLKDIDNYQEEGKFLCMEEFPDMIKLLIPFIQIDPPILIEKYYNSITFIREFNSFYEFKDIFSQQFDAFYIKNIVKMRKDIRYQIIDNIDYYRCNDMDIEFDMHLDYYIEEVCRKYGVRITSKFVTEIEDTAERSFHYLKKRPEKKVKKKPKSEKDLIEDRFKPKKFSHIVSEYLPEESYEEFNPGKYLKAAGFAKVLIKQITNELKKEDSVIKAFTDNSEIFSAFIDWLFSERLDLIEYNEYSILDSFYNYYCKQANLNSEKLKHFFFELAKDSLGSYNSMTKTQLEKVICKNNISNCTVEKLFPVITPEKNWFKFSSYGLRVYFVVTYLSAIENQEEFENEAIDFSYEVHGYNLLNLLYYSCKEKLLILVNQELKRFINTIDTTSEKTIVLSFLAFFNIEYAFEWDSKSKSFIVNSSSNTEAFMEVVFQYLKIDFNIVEMDIYFCKDCFYLTNMKKYFIKANAYKMLLQKVKTLIYKVKRKDVLTGKEVFLYDLNLFEFTTDNYEVMREIGLEQYIIALFKSIYEKCSVIDKG